MHLSKIFYALTGTLAVTVCLCALFLYDESSRRQPYAKSVVSVTGLPDAALNTGARYIRHRSIADVYSVFNQGPDTRELFPGSFIYTPYVEAGLRREP